MLVSRRALCLALSVAAARTAWALDLPRFPRGPASRAYPATYLPVGGPPDEQVDLWPSGTMPGHPTKYNPNHPEQFLRTEDTPNASQALRFKCSPKHVGTHGHFALSVSNPTIAPFLAEGSDVAVVIAPSGGGMHLNWDVESVSPAKVYQSWGISAFIVKFRVPVGFWSPKAYLQDIQRAISMARTQYGMRLVGVHGACFGGRAAMEASNSVERSYEPVDASDHPHFRPDFTVLLYPQGGLSIPSRPKVIPPVFAAVSHNDNCAGFIPAKMYVQNSAIRGAATELHIYPTGMHGWGTCEYYPFLLGESECNWPNELRAFLQKTRVLP